jgi:hypothetical protein
VPDARALTEFPTLEDLPVACMDIAGYHVVVGDLGNAPKDAEERLSEYTRVALGLRGRRPIAEQDDVVLLLSVPAGDPPWQNVAAAIERNDLVCRKLVWLPPQDLGMFLARTFLARPWVEDSPATTPELDILGLTRKALSQRIGEDRAEDWFTVILEHSRDKTNASLAKHLLERLEGGRQ